MQQGRLFASKQPNHPTLYPVVHLIQIHVGYEQAKLV